MTDDVRNDGGGLRLGVVLFDHEEGKRRLETLADWRRGVRDPLGIGALGGYFSGRLFPAVKSNMRPQPDRFLWVPAIAEYACERTLREAGSIARAKAAIEGAVEDIERRAWDAIAEASKEPRYRFKPRATSYTWFASLPHHAYLPTLRRMGLIRESTVASMLAALVADEGESDVPGPDSRGADPGVPRAAEFRRAVDRRKRWLATVLGRRHRASYPVLTTAERRLLCEVLAWYGTEPRRKSLLAWCIERQVQVDDALADWKASKRLSRSSKPLAELVRAAGAFRRCAATVEAWLAPRLGERGIAKRIPEQSAAFDAERRALKRDLDVVEAHLDAVHNGSDGAGAPTALSAASPQRSLDVLKTIVVAAQKDWRTVQVLLADEVLARKGTRRRFRAPERPDTDEQQAEQDDEGHGLNSWLAREIVAGLVG